MSRRTDDAYSAQPPLPSEQQVMAYLRHHRDFLLRHPEMALLLAPPSRFEAAQNATRQGVVDMQVYMIDRLKDEISRIKGAQEDLIHTSRNTISTQNRTHDAVLMLLEADNLAELAEVVSETFPPLFDLDVASLCFEESPKFHKALNVPGVFFLPHGNVSMLLGGRDRDCAFFEQMPGDAMLFGEGADLVASSALARLTVADDTPAGLLALGSRHDNAFRAGQATEMLGFLSRVIERCLYRFL